MKCISITTVIFSSSGVTHQQPSLQQRILQWLQLRIKQQPRRHFHEERRAPGRVQSGLHYRPVVWSPTEFHLQFASGPEDPLRRTSRDNVTLRRGWRKLMDTLIRVQMLSGSQKLIHSHLRRCALFKPRYMCAHVYSLKPTRLQCCHWDLPVVVSLEVKCFFCLLL